MWAAPDGEPGWALDTEPAAWVVLPRGGLTAATTALLTDFARARAGRGAAVALRTLRTAGVSLAEIEERLAAWLAPGESGSDATVSAASVDGEVSVRLRARGVSAEAAAQTLAALEERIVEALGEDCYGRDGEHARAGGGPPARRARLHAGAGRVVHRRPGRSPAHQHPGLLGLLRARHGRLLQSRQGRAARRPGRACCASTARSAGRAPRRWCAGACERSGAACGLAITGIAGPDGGTPTKPVGTVFIGVAVAGTVEARQFRFPGGRSSVKWQSSQMALDMLRRRLAGSGPLR